jgi:hypothetical protein
LNGLDRIDPTEQLTGQDARPLGIATVLVECRPELDHPIRQVTKQPRVQVDAGLRYLIRYHRLNGTHLLDHTLPSLHRRIDLVHG